MQTVQSLIFLALLIGIFYFMLIRPQKKRVQQHQSLLESIGVGDEVVTIGGMHGTIRSIGNDDVEIEAAPGVTIRYVKNAIARRVTEDLDDQPAAIGTTETTDATADDATDATATADTTETADAADTTTADAETAVIEKSDEAPATAETSEDEKS